MKTIISSTCIVLTLLLVSCGSGTPRFQKKATDKIIREYAEYPNYSILLYDMDYNESNDQFLHQYQIIYQPLDNPDTLLSTIRAWEVVNEQEFQAHQENLGMALVTKTDGVVEKSASPPGFNQYVGNERYGSWERHSDGSSFWRWYGQYMFMSTMFNMAFAPRYSYWNDYHRNYRPYGRTYYGGSGTNRRYGTGSSTRYGRSWKSKPQSFKSRVQSRVKRSASTRSRFNRRSSRYGGRSFRSRGGGFGK